MACSMTFCEDVVLKAGNAALPQNVITEAKQMMGLAKDFSCINVKFMIECSDLSEYHL